MKTAWLWILGGLLLPWGLRAGETPGTNGVDLRPRFQSLQLPSRRQLDRPTCSVFAVVGAVEFAIAKQQGRCPPLSVEFLNWASNQECKNLGDGGFFSDLWKGFAAYGICAETNWPYGARFDPHEMPSAAALSEAKRRLDLGLRLHWIKRWDVKTGLADREFDRIQRTLDQGYPVCAGLRWPKRERWKEGVLQMCGADAVYDGHSLLLVGYRPDAAQPGGGVFLFRNSSGDAREGAMPFDYARRYINDAVWVDAETR